MNLFVLCSHGRRSAHDVAAGKPTDEFWHAEEWCPGGRPATLEDLGGEKVTIEALAADHLPEVFSVYPKVESGDYLLIPLSDSESVGVE